MNKATVIEKLLTHRDDTKSLIFLFPLLQLPKNVVPIGTYLQIESVDLGKTRPLICLFHKNHISQTVRTILSENKFFDFSISDDEYEYFFFEFTQIANIYDTILRGEYTKLTLNTKILLSRTDHPISEIAIHPENYYQDYADELNCDVETIMKKVELIEPPFLEKETVCFGKKALAELLTELS
jgi:hypothetical protein